jgi:hypothetical protein
LALTTDGSWERITIRANVDPSLVGALAIYGFSPSSEGTLDLTLDDRFLAGFVEGARQAWSAVAVVERELRERERCAEAAREAARGDSAYPRVHRHDGPYRPPHYYQRWHASDESCHYFERLMRARQSIGLPHIAGIRFDPADAGFVEPGDTVWVHDAAATVVDVLDNGRVVIKADEPVRGTRHLWFLLYPHELDH